MLQMDENYDTEISDLSITSSQLIEPKDRISKPIITKFEFKNII